MNNKGEQHEPNTEIYDADAEPECLIKDQEVWCRREALRPKPSVEV